MKTKLKTILIILSVLLVSVMVCLMTIILVSRNKEKPVIHIIALAGQSNCEGVSLNSALATKVTKSKYELYGEGFNNVDIVSVSNGLIVDPIQDCKLGFGTSANHFGIEIGIADYLLEHYPDTQFCLVKKAVGGTELGKHWSPSDDNPNYGIHLRTLITGVNNTIKQYEDMGYIVKVDAYCFMQGEEESASGRMLEYYNDINKMVTTFRNAFDKYNDSTIRYIDGGVYNQERFQYADQLNAIKKSYADTSEYNYFIDTVGMELTRKNTEIEGGYDIFHYDSLSMLRLGLAFGERVLGDIDNYN